MSKSGFRKLGLFGICWLAGLVALGQGIRMGGGVTLKTSGAVYLKVSGGLSADNSSQLILAEPSQLSITGNLATADATTDLRGTLIMAGGSAQSISAGSTLTVNNLTVNNASGVSLQVPVTVTSTLSLSRGNVATTEDNVLTLEGSTTFKGGSSSSFINGVFAIRTLSVSGGEYDLTFPVGRGSSFKPVTLKFTQTSAAGTTYRAQVINGAIPDYELSDDLSDVSTARYWSIDNGEASNFQDAEITLPVGSDDIDDISEAVVARSDDASWESVGGKVNTSSGTVSSTKDFGSLGDFIVARRLEPANPPSFTLSVAPLEEDEDFTGVRTITIVPDEDTPAATYSFAPELNTIDLVSVNYDASAKQISVSSRPDANGSVSIDITALDEADPSNVAEQTLNITINPVNDLPTVANPLDPIFVSQDADPVVVDISSVFSDVDGDDLSYTAESSDSDVVTTQLDGTSLTLTFVAGATGNAVVTIAASDGVGEPVSHPFDVSVLSPGENLPPVANAGPDQRVSDDDQDGSEEVELDGSASSDSDGEIVSYRWSEDEEPLPGGTTEQPTVTLEVGVHVIVLTVTDDSGDTDTDTVSVVVENPDNPEPPGEDSVDPEIVSTSFLEVFEINGAQPLSLGVVATDNQEVSVAGSSFRYAGIMQDLATEARTTEVESSDGDTYSVPLAQDELLALDPLGIQYQFVIQDASGNATSSAIGKTYWRYDIEMPTQKNLVSQPEQDDYQLVAVPFVQQAVTSAWPGLSYNKENIRLFRHDPSLPADDSYEEYNTSGFSNFEPGRGYWLIAKPTALDQVQGEVVPPDSEGNIAIEVEAGWNLIGNPFPFAINWNEIRDFQENGDLLQNSGIIKVFRTSNYSTDDVVEIRPYEGFFVNINRSGTLMFPMQSATNGRWETRPAKPVSLDEADWRVSLTLLASDSSRQRLELGTHPRATVGRDYYDADVFPEFFSSHGIAFQRGDFQFSTDVIPSTTYAEWDILVPDDQKTTWFSLQWDHQSWPESRHQLWLFNPSTLQVVDMRQESRYRFSSSSEAQHLKVLYGTPWELLEHLSPERLTIGGAYPNPAQRTVRVPVVVPTDQAMQLQLRMLDTTGKVVLANSHSVAAGVHNITTRIDLKAGVYYLQILSEAGEVLDIQKVLITP